MLYIATSINFCCGCFLLHIQKYKCLGMQTLLDCVLNNVIMGTMLCFGSFTIVCTLATFFTGFNPILAKMIMSCFNLLSINSGLSLASVAVIRYLLVFHGEVFHKVHDNEVMKYLRMTNGIISMVLLTIDMVMFYDIDESSKTYTALWGRSPFYVD